jgi:hypothetical protein
MSEPESHAFRDALAAAGIQHKRTRPDTPCPNGPGGEPPIGRISKGNLLGNGS